MKLESSIKELHDMFMDIAMLVENQVTGVVPASWGREGSSGRPRRMLEAGCGGTVIGSVRKGETAAPDPRGRLHS